MEQQDLTDADVVADLQARVEALQAAVAALNHQLGETEAENAQLREQLSPER